MNSETVVTLLVEAAALPATLFVILYPILSPSWWRSWIGRALLASSTGLALLLDLSLATKWFGPTFLAREPVMYTILVIIAAGAWMKFLALVVTKLSSGREQ